MDQNAVYGGVMAFSAIVLYGSCYLPVRWFEAKDGIFFQWLMNIGQFLVGVAVYIACDCPPFEPLSMLTGVQFAIGNGLTVFIMDGVGMAVGVLLWNTVCCVVGWAISRFGLFGTPQSVPYNNLLNIIGVIGVCIGGAFFAPIRHHPMKVRPAPAQYLIEDGEKTSTPKYPSTSRRALSIALCLFVGFLYGNMVTPINYAIANGANPHMHNHFFASTVGSLFTSTFIFAGYGLYKKNRPFINPELALPSLLSGLIYGAATCCMLAAIEHLGQIIAYPIISKSPGVVASFWAVYLFKEIRGKNNFLMLIVGITATIGGVIIISLSKVPF
ncbi:unnamed protein product [Auanema sp. JU1783]|nr:unnamed protein product [Auanema sp. JU1783]